MDNFERRIAVLLHDAVPEPQHAVSVREVERLGRRRRAVAVATPIVAVVAVVLAVVATITVARRDEKPVPPARPKSSTLNLHGLKLTYPQGWHAFDRGNSTLVAGKQPPLLSADNPSGVLSSEKPGRVCQAILPSGRACRLDVATLPADGIYVGYNTFVPTMSMDAGLDTRVAGRPASVTDDFNVATECPEQTASTTDVVVKIGPQTYLSIMGCLGSSPSATKAFRALLASARWTG